MRKFATALFFIPLLLLTLQPLVWGSSTGPALEVPPTPTAVATATETAVPIPTLHPTQTPTPETLTATLVEAFPLGSYPASAPVTVQFNQPMKPGSLKVPLLTSPSVQGKTVWNDDFTSFTFTPDADFRGKSTTLTLHSALQSADGKTFTRLQRWRLRHPESPQVNAGLETAVLNQLYPTIHLRFTQPMDADSVTAALSVTPALPFTTEWKNETQVTLTFTQPFVGDVDYEVRLAKTAVSQYGLSLSSDANWTYRLADPIAKLDPAVQINGKTAVRLHFNYPIDPSATNTFTFSPAVAGSWQWEDEKTAVLFIPDTTFTPDSSYQLQISAPLHDINGAPLPTPKTQSFTAAPLIARISPSAGAIVDLETNIRLDFAQAVDQTAVEQAITIAPATNGRFNWQNNSLLFIPTDGWQYDTTYTLTIAPTLFASDGTPLLPTERVHQFTTERTPPIQPAATFGWGEKVQQLFPDGRRAIQYLTPKINIPIQATLYPLTLPQFVTHYGTSFAGLSSGYGGDEPQVVATDGLTAVATWPITPTPAISETLLPATIPPGLYLLNLGDGQLDDQLFVTLSDYTLVLKQGNGQLVAWVTDRNGRSQPNATVTLYNHNATPLAQALTNDDGIATFAPRPEGITLAVAELNGQTTLSGLGNDWTSYGGWGSTPRVATVHVYTDRPLYQPGQTVYYKAIIRRNNDARLDILPEGTAVTATIWDAQGGIVQTTTLATNWFGTVHGSFALAEGATLGSYRLEIRTLDEGHGQTFKVTAQHNPTYSVVVTTDPSHPVIGDTVQITVEAVSDLGEPVANAEVTLKVYEPAVWYGYAAKPIQAKTDENGRFTTTFPTKQLAQEMYGEASKHLAIEAIVKDSDQQAVSGLTAIRLYAAAETLTIAQSTRFFPVNAPFQLPITVQTIQGQPVNGRSFTLSLHRYNHMQDNYAQRVWTETATTDENGRLSHPITLPQAGGYKLTITGLDSRQQNLSQTTYLYAYQNEGNSYYSRQEDLVLYLDKDHYAPGETAQLFIQSTFDGPALLTWERDTTHRQQRVELTAPITRVEIPVLPTDAPNIHLVISAWQPLTNTLTAETTMSLPESRLLLGSVNLVVPPADKQLQITLTPNKPTYAPGEEATFTVRVTNPAGVPVSAELSLALVDEAVFAFSHGVPPAIDNSFYYLRNRTTYTSDSLSPERYLNEWWMGGCGCGGGEGPMEVEDPRTNFPDAAAWFPVRHTDYNGEVTVTVTMPDSLTSWRLTAVATTTDTQVGETYINVQTQ